MTHDCDDCGHSCPYSVCIGDTAYGNYADDWECEMDGKMTDEEVEMANEGKCPYWKELDG